MNVDHQGFSRSAKVILYQYLSKERYDLAPLENFLEGLLTFDFELLKSDAERLAFWINIYNGFTGYQIVKSKLKNSVFDKPDFFTNRGLAIGKTEFSLDDIEHGILRNNGERKNNKPRQFSAGEARRNLMVDTLDSRVHFALNCGSISCPPIAFYEASKIDKQLALAEESFSQSEFLVNHEKRMVECSSIFIWYRIDFGSQYLNDPELSHYEIIERPYIWKIQ